MKIIGALLAAVFGLAAMAQEQTLLDSRIENGGFGGPVLKVTRVNGEAALMTGGAGGWIIDHSFVIGAAAYGLVTNVKANVTDSTHRYVEAGYGGLDLQYVLSPNRLLHLSAGLLLGGGGIEYRDEDAFYPRYLAFFVVEPAVAAHLNVTHFFRIATGLSYRYVTGLKSDLSSNADLSAPSAFLAFQFGRF